LIFVVVVASSACGPASLSPGMPDGGGTVTGDKDADPTPAPCTSGQLRCFQNRYQVCADGEFKDQEVCQADQQCDSDLGCVDCSPEAGNVCVGEEIHSCNSDGTIGAAVKTCASPEVCAAGTCVNLCDEAAKARSYIGCEYWPVDLDNALAIGSTLDCLLGGIGEIKNHRVCATPSGEVGGECEYADGCDDASTLSGMRMTCETQSVCVMSAQHSPFAVVVANPDPVNSVKVTLTNSTGTTHTETVRGGAVSAIFPQEEGFADQSLDYTGIENKAYRITSTRPIVAYQFNPLDNVGVFSNDGSLLLPEHTYDKSYYAASWPSGYPFNGFLTVVASRPGTTTVTVTPKVKVRAGTGVSELAAGVSREFKLQQFQTLNLEAVLDADLTGSEISCDVPCGVFGGHEAAAIFENAQSICCADHLEDQIFPASTWGKKYAVARVQSRGRNEADLVRVMAQRAGTRVTFTPAAGACSGTLGPGEYCDVFIKKDVEISANEPILVSHYLTAIGKSTDTTNPPGDPALAFAVPIEQYRTSYTILVPDKYTDNYVSLIAAMGSSVLLDGGDVGGQLASFGTDTYGAARVKVKPGVHKIECGQTCGVEVYGFSEAVSYLFAGGLDLNRIVIE
jgi:hypothetical protein